MRKPLLFALFFGICLVSALSQASAAEKLITAQDPEAVLNLAKGYGRAELTTDGAGDPRIHGKMDGLEYNVFFHGCTNNKDCESIQFETGWGKSARELSLDEVNAWNGRKLFAHCVKNQEGLIRVRMDVLLRFGMAEKNLDAYFDVWKSLVNEFVRDVLQKK